jgi:5'-nucleotidase
MDVSGNNSRRKFISQLAKATALTGIVGIPSELFAAKDVIKLTVLHTNDTHSRIDPFPENDPKFPGMGGVARRMEMIQQVRNQEEHVLLLDSGDIFQGTPYFNLYGGELEFKLMSKMGYDAATMGNHDFDNGIEGFAKQLPHASFPFLCSNYDFNQTLLAGKTIPYKIFEKGSIRVGVFGIGIELKGLVDSKAYGNTIYNDPVDAANTIAEKLKKHEHCDLVICLSHLGYKYDNSSKVSDEILAKKTSNIDLILGGHTHTFLDTPVQYMNKEQKVVLVAQTGWAGIRLGRIDFFAERKSKKFASNGTTVKISNNSR